MSQHYYSKQPDVRHDRKTIDTELRGRKLRFTSDAGVFSKGDIDYGSRVLIEMMEIAPDAKVLDIGCGYGPIGISAALLAEQGHVTMVDINERAVELAAENAARNGAGNVTVLQSDIAAALNDDKFDVVLTNPPIRAGKSVVHAVFEQAYHHLEQNGELWVVIQKKQGAPSAAAKLEELFGEVEEMGKDRGYRILKAKKS